MISQDDIDAFKDTQEPPSQVGLYDMNPDWAMMAKGRVEMVQEFAKAMDQPLDQEWQKDKHLEKMRWGLIHEEYLECCDASSDKVASNMLKELADLVYVCFGYAATYGWDLDTAVYRVHKSNMSKLGLDGKPIKRPDGKVIKGPNYQKPNLFDLVESPNE
mgnify:CR=1 FL=1